MDRSYYDTFTNFLAAPPLLYILGAFELLLICASVGMMGTIMRRTAHLNRAPPESDEAPKHKTKQFFVELHDVKGIIPSILAADAFFENGYLWLVDEDGDGVALYEEDNVKGFWTEEVSIAD